MQSSRPSSQIACAEPYLRYLLETPAVKTDPTHASEIVALLHLAGALAAPPPYRTNAHSPSDVGKISDSSVTCFHSDAIVPTVGIIGVHYTPSRARDAEALSLFERAFALYDSVGRPYARSPSPFSGSPVAPSGSTSALGLNVSPQPAPAITPASPTFAYCVPTSPRASLALDSPRSQRLSGLCGRKGKLPPKTELWARAAYVKFLRRLNDADASKGHADEMQRQLEIMR